MIKEAMTETEEILHTLLPQSSPSLAFDHHSHLSPEKHNPFYITLFLAFTYFSK